MLVHWGSITLCTICLAFFDMTAVSTVTDAGLESLVNFYWITEFFSLQMSVLNLFKSRQETTAKKKSAAVDVNLNITFLVKALSLLISLILVCFCVLFHHPVYVYVQLYLCVCACVSKSLFLSHKWVTVWSWCGEFVFQCFSFCGLYPWHASCPQCPCAYNKKRPVSGIRLGIYHGSPSSLFCVEEPFVRGLKSLGMYV